MKRNLSKLMLLLILCLLPACKLPFLLGRAKPAVDMRITNEREIKLDDISIMDRSPDGQWLVAYSYPNPPESDFCIYKSEDMTQQFCMPEQDDTGIALQPVTWSPDSRKLTFVERLPNIPIDTDIWVLNVESARLENITEDNISGIISAEMETFPFLDTAPAWSPDGIWIAFARTTYDTELLTYETALYKVPAIGGAAEKIITVSYQPGAIPNGMLVWLADDRLIYTPRGEGQAGRPIGLHTAKISGDEPPQRLENLSDTLVSSQLISTSPDSKYALLLHEMQSSANTIYALPYLFNLQNGDSFPLKAPLPNDIPDWFARSNWVAFSPDSSKVAYFYESETPTAQWRLALVDIGGDEEAVLKTFESRKYFVNYPLRWGEDNTLMIRLVAQEPPTVIMLLTVK